MRCREGTLDATGMRLGVVASRFNSVVTDRLLDGALQALREHGAAEDDIEVIRVPGAFEIPLATKVLADANRVDGVICLGAVIRGETPHFEYIAASVVAEIGRLMVERGVPIALGVLTTNTVEQALARAGGGHGNKGAEAAVTAIEMVNLRKAVG